jgi:hypothetical protein
VGCGGPKGGTGATGPAPAPATAPATAGPSADADQLARMKQLVDGAESAADAADSEAAADG